MMRWTYKSNNWEL